MSAVGPVYVRPPPQEWISMRITNSLESGTIVVQNPTLNTGEFLDDYTTREHYYGSVHNRPIYPGMLQIISAHASKSGRGTSGTIPLWEGSTLIGTLYWNCPGGGGQNSLQGYNVDGNYWVGIGAFSTSGPIGDVNITIQRA